MIDKSTIQKMRGIAIFSVVVFHALSVLPISDFWDEFNATINIIGMTAFFLISGYVFELNFYRYREGGFRRFAIKKLIRLGIPYLTYSVIIYVVVAIANFIPSINIMLSDTEYHAVGFMDFCKAVLLFNNHVGVYLWFILCLLFITVLSYFYKLRSPILECLIVCILSCILRSWVSSTIIFRIVFYFPIFTIGRAIFNLKAVKTKFEGRRSTYIIVLAGLGVSIFFYSSIYSMDTDRYEIAVRLLRYIDYLCIGVFGTVLIYAVSKAITNKRLSIISKLGDNSYAIYLMHQPFITPIITSLIYMISENILVSVFIGVAVGITIPLVLASVIIKQSRILSLLLLGKEHPNVNNK